MERRIVIVGQNFSGRSALLRRHLDERPPGTCFFLGPYAEAALSGLSSTVADEIALYAAAFPPPRPGFPLPLDEASLDRKPSTLSGGEQVMLALHCFSRSGYATIGIDVALEQFDPARRAEAFAFLADADAVLVDNRIERLDGWEQVTASKPATEAPMLDLPRVIEHLTPRNAPAIAVRGLRFGYGDGAAVLDDATFSLEPGNAHRLEGPNGAGKTTLLKLLTGVLAPQRGTLTCDGKPYAPWQTGNRVFALATQNPDHQWCGATPREDIARRLKGSARRSDPPPPSAEFLGTLAGKFGLASLDDHLYELPLVLRKRLSWLWALSGAMPWLFLDEPTIGQDGPTRAALADAIGRVTALGYGVVFITHDDKFADLIRHRSLTIEGRTVVAS